MTSFGRFVGPRVVSVAVAVLIVLVSCRETPTPADLGVEGMEVIPGCGAVQKDAFLLDVVTVTNRMFREFVRKTKYKTDAEKYGWSFVLVPNLHPDAESQVTQSVRDAPWWLNVPKAYWRMPYGTGSTIGPILDYPVVHISFNDAQAYCNWMRKRLPTESEWLCAAKGGFKYSKYPWGNNTTGLENRMNVWHSEWPPTQEGPSKNSIKDGYAGLAPAVSYNPQNQFGLYNMLGNVWEWCDSPGKDSTERVLRGGSYVDSVDGSFNHGVTLKARMTNTIDSSADNTGFRCATKVPHGDFEL